MHDEDKTKQQLIDELAGLRQQVAELEEQSNQYEQVKQALQESEELYRTIFEKAQLGVGVADAQGNLITFNDAMLEPGSYTRDDIAKIKNVALLYYDTDERDRILAMARQRGSVHRQEVQFKRKDGSPYDTLLSLSHVQVKGQPGWLAIVEDVTERKQVQGSLRLSEQRYRLLVENLPRSAIILLDHELRFVLVDGPEVEAVGFSKKMLEGKTIYETFPPEFVQMVEPNIRAALAGEFLRVELPGVDDAFYFYSYVPLKNESGEIVMAMILAQNITQLKEAERQLVDVAIQRERIQLLEELINDLSHDIRTPLSSINSLLYLIQKNLGPEKQQEYIDRLEAQVWRLDKLVDAILFMAHLGTNMKPDVAPVQVASLLQDVDGIHQELAELKQITLVCNISPEVPAISGNESEIRRALDNLLSNALTYTPDEGTVSIHAFTQNEHVIVEIADNGIGIAEEEIPRIFERFYRVDKARNSDQGGTGLGLAIVKKVAERHGGKVEVESKLGDGATFRLWLPVSTNGHVD